MDSGKETRKAQKRSKHAHRTRKQIREEEPHRSVATVGQTTPDQMAMLQAGLALALAPDAPLERFEAWWKLAQRWALIP